MVDDGRSLYVHDFCCATHLHLQCVTRLSNFITSNIVCSNLETVSVCITILICQPAHFAVIELSEKAFRIIFHIVSEWAKSGHVICEFRHFVGSGRLANYVDLVSHGRY